MRESAKLDIKVNKEENDPLEGVEINDAVEAHHDVEEKDQELVAEWVRRILLIPLARDDFGIFVAGDWELVLIFLHLVLERLSDRHEVDLVELRNNTECNIVHNNIFQTICGWNNRQTYKFLAYFNQELHETDAEWHSKFFKVFRVSDKVLHPLKRKVNLRLQT